MGVSLQFRSAQEAAHAVRNVVAPQVSKSVHVRPKSFYDPDNTVWWAVPAKHTPAPAYQYGKLSFQLLREPLGHLACGLHVEKGFTVPGATTDAQQVMRADWTWHQFFRDLDSDAMASAVETASRNTGGPVTLYLLAHPDDPQGQLDHVTFVWQEGVLQRVDGEGNSAFRLENVLTTVKDSRSLAELVSNVQAIQGLGWYWLNAFLGCTFQLSGDPRDRRVWDADDLWELGLSMWEPWFA